MNFVKLDLLLKKLQVNSIHSILENVSLHVLFDDSFIDGGIWSPSATPRFHDCKYNLHRKVALQIATGNLHPANVPFGASNPDQLRYRKNPRIKNLGFFLWLGLVDAFQELSDVLRHSCLSIS